MSCLLNKCIDWPCRFGKECAFHADEIMEILTGATKGFDLKIKITIEKEDKHE